MTPLVDTAPRVGLSPTRDPLEEGDKIDPSVSLPSATRAKLALIATAEPALDPEGVEVKL
jgi:hypothetical protein